MKIKKIYSVMLILTFAAIINACNILEEKNENGSAQSGSVVIANSDYTTGSLSSLNTESMTGSNGILQGEVDSDLRVRSYNNLIYVLNNTLQNILLIDPNDGFKILKQVSTGAKSYPHDIAVIGSKGYVSLNGSSGLRIINPSTLETTGEIDLSSYSSPGESNPSMDQIWIDEAAHKLYLSIGRLKVVDSIATTDYSSVLVIDMDTDKVIKEIKLQWTISETTMNGLNPYSKFVFASKDAWNNGDGHDHIFILCQGLLNSTDWSDKLDGGVIAIDTTDLSCETGFLVTETFLGNSMSDFDYANGKFYVATSSASSGELFVVQPFDAGKSSILQAEGWGSIPFAKVNSTGLLLVGDRTSTNPGIWIFNTSDNILKNSLIISTGLPPSDITLIQ